MFEDETHNGGARKKESEKAATSERKPESKCEKSGWKNVWKAVEKRGKTKKTIGADSKKWVRSSKIQEVISQWLTRPVLNLFQDSGIASKRKSLKKNEI